MQIAVSQTSARNSLNYLTATIGRNLETPEIGCFHVDQNKRYVAVIARYAQVYTNLDATGLINVDSFRMSANSIVYDALVVRLCSETALRKMIC